MLLIIVSVAARGSFWGLSASSMSSIIALHDFFNAWMENLAFEEAKVELICCCEHAIDLVRVVPGAIFEGSSMSEICKGQVYNE
jgi:hypothetical protein